MMIRRLFPLVVLAVILAGPRAPSRAGDWPTWRYDAGHTAASPDDLPDSLQLHWTRQYTEREQVWDDPLNNDLMQYDKVLEPIVVGDRVLLGLNDCDKVVALDVNSGDEVWTFYTDGPVRLPPVGWKDRAFFTSDDGFLYCVQSRDGKLVWKFSGAPSQRKVLGNKRLISMWPARGGPVVRDDTVYFAASIWPFLGTFVYALDADTGKVQWVNDNMGHQYIKQPHSAPAFGGVAPQGSLVATADTLLVPGGRSVPAALDRQNGQLRYFRINDGGKGNGGSFVTANDSVFFVHTRRRGVRQFDLKTGEKSDVTLNEPVLDGDTIYTATAKAVMAIGPGQRVKWQLSVDGSGDLIRAGRRLYAAGNDRLTAIAVPGGSRRPRAVWSVPVQGQVRRLVAGGDKLLAVTQDGRILAYGAGPPAGPPTAHVASIRPTLAPASAKAQSMLQSAGVDRGYAIVYGADDGKMLDMLVANSQLHVVTFDPDPEKVATLRQRYGAAGLYGKRISVHQGDPRSAHAPPYIARLVVVGRSLAAQYATKESIEAIYASVRPYGGVLWFPVTGKQQAEIAALVQAGELPNAKLVTGESNLLVFREGPLPGSAPWTHLYGDIANTVKSQDQLVKPPLGILWFGGNSNMDVLPRHGHGPCPQVIGGRLFIEGINSLSARDVYTGRVLWKRQFKDLGTYGIYYDQSYKNTPLDTAYNQLHIPGANARGTNFVATAEGVYLVVGSECQILDPESGKTRKVIRLPRGTGSRWAYIGVYEDVLLGGTDFGDYTRRMKGVEFKTAPKKSRAWSFDWFASRGLVAFNRFTGDVLWKMKADYGFLHDGIVAGNGRVYLLDKLPREVERQLTRRGRTRPLNYRLMALGARTGQVIWESNRDVFGTWLGYSEPHDILLQAGAASKDRSPDEVGQGMITCRGADGQVIWKNPDLKYAGPCIIHNDRIIANSQSYDRTSGVVSLLDGSPVMVTNPITGKPEPWQYERSYGCNTAVASEHMILFRSGAAGYYDLDNPCGVGNFGGFRSSCSSNVLAADGVLSAPDYTRTCSCPYQNQTSLALVHMPDIVTWSRSQFDQFGNGDRVQRLGINFGAPGARRSDQGALWLEYPTAADELPPIKIDATGDGLTFFRRHPTAAHGAGLKWVAVSGARNLRQLSVGVNLGKGSRSREATKYTVRLHFSEPDHVEEGQRVFDVAVQGKTVLSDFDVFKESGGQLRDVVRELPGVAAASEITITLTPKGDHRFGPVLSGVELVAE